MAIERLDENSEGLLLLTTNGKVSAAVGFATLRLVRVRIGKIEPKNMLSGDAVEVEDLELALK